MGFRNHCCVMVSHRREKMRSVVRDFRKVILLVDGGRNILTIREDCKRSILEVVILGQGVR